MSLALLRLALGGALISLVVAHSVFADAAWDDVQPPGDQAAKTPASVDLAAICTDRPTKSNNACTVDAGHFQLESDLFNGTFARQNGVTTDTYLVTSPTLKYGLSSNIDIQVNVAPYEYVKSTDKFGDKSTLSGVGDLYFRLKYNFYNSPDGNFSVAVIPYVKAPTARTGIGDGAWEGGASLPVSYKLSDTVSITTQPEVDSLKDSVGDGRHVNTSQLINLGYNLPHNVTVYGELFGDWNLDPSGTTRQYSADAAASWGVTKYFQLDGGLNFGLNRSTPGVQAYFGVSQKF